MPGDPMGGFRTLGRLLAVGLAAGAVIGGTTGALIYAPTGAVPGILTGVMLGAVFGLVLGGVTQVITATLAFVGRHFRLSRRATGLVVQIFPVAAACGVAWWVTASLDTWTGLTMTATALALGLGLLAVRTTTPWCLAPIADQYATART